MNGIKLLLLLVASAQVEVGTEKDYGWKINPDDDVLEYIVQINPDKKRAMETPSPLYRNGVENASNMPSELVGRASRVVVRFGSEILPREPSLQELDRMPRLYAQPNVNAAAVLGDDKYRTLEALLFATFKDKEHHFLYPHYPMGCQALQTKLVTYSIALVRRPMRCVTISPKGSLMLYQP